MSSPLSGFGTGRGDAIRSDEQTVVDGEPINPRLHLAMHQIVANQLLADDPPETWQTVQRLAVLGYDWHNIMHMIAPSDQGRPLQRAQRAP